MPISIYCNKCKKSFTTNSVDRRHTEGKDIKGRRVKPMITYIAKCPRCDTRCYKYVARSK